MKRFAAARTPIEKDYAVDWTCSKKGETPIQAQVGMGVAREAQRTKLLSVATNSTKSARWRRPIQFHPAVIVFVGHARPAREGRSLSACGIYAGCLGNSPDKGDVYVPIQIANGAITSWIYDTAKLYGCKSVGHGTACKPG